MKRMRYVSKNSILLSIRVSKNVQDWVAIFIWRVGCLNVEKWENNSERV